MRRSEEDLRRKQPSACHNRWYRNFLKGGTKSGRKSTRPRQRKESVTERGSRLALTKGRAKGDKHSLKKREVKKRRLKT